MSSVYKLDVYAALYEAERRSRKACQQYYIVKERLGGLKARYVSALLDNNKIFIENLKRRILTVDRLMQTYNAYVLMKNDEIRDLRIKLFRGEEEDVGEY
jgi:hypothetical protein